MKQYKFSLIEIAISLAVAFLAITVLIAFFPTSFKRLKGAQQRSYATNAAQQFNVYLKNTLTTFPVPGRHKIDATTYNTEYAAYLTKWNTEINTPQNTSANNSLPQVAYAEDDIAYDSSSYYDLPANFEGTHIVQHKTNPSVYLIRNVTFLNGSSHVDNMLEVRIWKSPYIFNSVFLPSRDGRDFSESNATGNYENDYSKAARINMEFSWPITTVYSKRKYKNYKFLDLVK